MSIAGRLTPGAGAAPLTGWRLHGAMLGIVSALILLAFARDAGDMAAIWWTSSTFQHVVLIPFILGWLVWQRIDALRALTPVAWAPGLALVGVGAFGWLLGDAAGVALARHAGLVLMLQGAVIACLGPQVARALTFPLAYALFLIPAGEELVPALQTLTAHMCMALLAISGVPAHIDGVFITTPNGYFEVAEACSGVKFLIAMLAFGVLAANQCFLDWRRRIGFVALAVVVPILANGIRAWGTIFVAFHGDPDSATGFDHIVYGWFFFAIVAALVLAIGWRFFDRPAGAWFVDVAKLPAAPRGQAALPVAGAVIALALTPLLWGAVIAAQASPLAPLARPQVRGWTLTDAAPEKPWSPRYDGADALLQARYRDAEGRTIDLAVAGYARQAEGREIVGYGQGAVDPASDWAWTADAPSPPEGKASVIVAPGPVRREVILFNRVAGNAATGGLAVKLATLRQRLFGGDQSATAILVSAEGEGARAAIDAFMAASGGPERLAAAVQPR